MTHPLLVDIKTHLICPALFVVILLFATRILASCRLVVSGHTTYTTEQNDVGEASEKAASNRSFWALGGLADLGHSGESLTG